MLAAAYTLGGLSRHHQQLHGEVAAFIGFAAQAKPARFESSAASALHTPIPLVLIHVTRQGDARDWSFIGRDAVTTPPLIEPLCLSVGPKSSALSWHTDTLTPRPLLQELRRPPEVNKWAAFSL